MKKMKALAIALLAMAFPLASCGDDNPSEGGSTPPGGKTGGTYAITFKKQDADQSQALTTSSFYTQIDQGGGYISSVASVEKVFGGKNGIKFGSSSATGSLELNISSSEVKEQISAITLETAQYNSEAGVFRVYVNGSSTAESTTISPASGGTINFASPVTLSKLKIDISSKRGYISAIKLVYGDGGDDSGGGNPPAGSHWYDEYVSDGYTYASSLPATAIKDFMGISSIYSYIPSNVECVYQLSNADTTNNIPQHVEIVFEGDLYDAVMDALDEDTYSYYDSYYGMYLLVNREGTYEVDLGFEYESEESETAFATSFSIYMFSDFYGTTLTSNTDWSSDDKASMQSLGVTLPFMKFGEEFEWNFEDGIAEFCDYYFYDLVEDYAALLESNDFTFAGYGDYGELVYIDANETVDVFLWWDSYGNEIYIQPHEAE